VSSFRDCVGHSAGLYSPPSQAQIVINQSRFFLRLSVVALMHARLTLALSQKGAKKFLELYGENMVCVR